MKPTTKERIDRFWEYVEIRGECWVWTGHIDKSGKPQFKSPVTNRAVQAQHFALQLQNIPIQKGKHIRTICGTQNCVRPAHLEVGGSSNRPPRPRKIPLERATKWIDRTDSCWIWTGGSARFGATTIIGENKKTINVKRLIYESRIGPIEDGKVPMPSECGNTLCVNPAHMEMFDRSGPISYNKRDPEKRFWEKVDKRGPDECWEWTAAQRRPYGQNENGYGVFDNKPAHRMSYEIYYGSIPDGKIVCHKCNNPSCVNPNHLYAGTPAENVRDIWLTGKMHRARVISNERADEILNFYLENPDTTLNVIAIREGINRTVLSRALSRARERRNLKKDE